MKCTACLDGVIGFTLGPEGPEPVPCGECEGSGELSDAPPHVGTPLEILGVGSTLMMMNYGLPLDARDVMAAIMLNRARKK